jgi:hypothetical protein
MPDVAISNALLPSGPGTASLEFESLSDVVEMVSRDETPLYSNLKKSDAKAMKEEWGTETIGTVAAAVARGIGFTAVPTPQIQNIRLDNYTELCASEGGVSDTMNALDAADDTNTYEHKLLKAGILLRRSINKLLHTPQAKDSTMALPKMATYPAYIRSGGMFASVAGTPGAAPAGTGADIPGVGTGPVDFVSMAPVDQVLEAARFFNGKPDTMYLSPRMKRKFSHLPDAGINAIGYRVNMPAPGNAPFTHVGVVDRYLSDFGMIETAMDIDAPNSQIGIFDHSYSKLLILPGLNFKEDPLGKRGSAKEYMIQWQGCYVNSMPESVAYINGYNA